MQIVNKNTENPFWNKLVWLLYLFSFFNLPAEKNLSKKYWNMGFLFLLKTLNRWGCIELTNMCLS